MRNPNILPILFCAALVLSSCGVHLGMETNVNNNVTNVELAESNFRILDRVSGSASATYVLGIGGFNNTVLIENAKSEMLANANLDGGSKAIANVSTDIYIGKFFPVYYQKTVTVSAHVVEFID